MSKAAKIPASVLWLIKCESLKDVSEPRGSVATRLENEIESRSERVPARETLEKMISAARNQPNPQEEPWSVLSLTNFDIPADALPAVLETLIYTLEEGFQPLTIRQAKWVARLYRTLTCPFKGRDLKTEIDVGTLYEQAVKYAIYEQSSTAMNDEIARIAKGVGLLQDIKLYSDYYRLTHEPDPGKLDNLESLEALVRKLKSPGVLKRLGLEDFSNWPEFEGISNERAES